MGTVTTGDLFRTFGPAIEDFYRKLCAAAEKMRGVAFVFALGASVPVKLDEDGRITEIFDGVRVPANCTAAVRVDQLQVLERASVFVTHCGMNSCSESLSKTVPVVAVPFFGDQIENAERFEELGCGVVQRYTQGYHFSSQWNPDYSRITEDSLASAIGSILNDPSYSTAIKALYDDVMEECGAPIQEKIDGMLKFADSAQQGGIFA
uniref:UDP-glycosyltransferases domain-containing protein n=1 Tax=Alexandrium andersonii TaxID=327968 RepID=A0A7S2D241_9DINO|mmetsp:Transcript_46604/g.105710  ORF Transcript_46604/g.105710 Transcript_46604/m.105710 type:complete len:207 (+) Transcript_46604:2-622(+)